MGAACVRGSGGRRDGGEGCPLCLCLTDYPYTHTLYHSPTSARQANIKARLVRLIIIIIIQTCWAWP